jgi:hypothetical protein
MIAATVPNAISKLGMRLRLKSAFPKTTAHGR